VHEYHRNQFRGIGLLPLIRDTLSHGIIIAAQSEADAARFLELGANPSRTRVTGNIKFDVELDPEIAGKGALLRSALFGQRPVWIAASTHDGEELLVLAAHKTLLERHPELLLVLVPRHPERFGGVRELIEKQAFNVVSRTEDQAAESSTEVFLVDTMGEVPLFYAASDIAFVGGSLIPVGGHNLLEPAAQGLPIRLHSDRGVRGRGRQQRTRGIRIKIDRKSCRSEKNGRKRPGSARAKPGIAGAAPGPVGAATRRK